MLSWRRRYETGFNGYGGSTFSTAAQYTAFANTTMLQRLATFIAIGKKIGGNAPVIGEWGLGGVTSPRYYLQIPADHSLTARDIDT